MTLFNQRIADGRIKGFSVDLVFFEQYPLKTHNTFGIDVAAKYFVDLTNLDQIDALLQHPIYQNNKHLWLGGGSNILFTQDFDGLVIKIDLKGIQTIEDAQDFAILEAKAGENWHDFVRHTLAHGLNGLENLSLIPGTVGASPVQNIGAYGVEVKDFIHEVVCVELSTGKETIFNNAACQFAYRDSFFKHAGKGQFLITAVRFKLHKQENLKTQYGDIQHELEKRSLECINALAISDAVISIRMRKLPDPKQLGNAGSFFKNPVVSDAEAKHLIALYPHIPHYPAPQGQIKIAAGWLIDQAGFKGIRHGHCGVHEHQALVLVNHGEASGEEILNLAKLIEAKVFALYQIKLEAEPTIL